MSPISSSGTRFLVLSDTHNLELEMLPETLKCPKVDVLLHCGDLTQVGGISAYKKALRFGSFNAELKLVIAGNHDISLDGDYWSTHLEDDDEPEEHQQAVDVMTSALTKEVGVTYLEEGLYQFKLKNGTTFSLYCTPYQPECGDWAFSYKRTEDRFNFDVPEGYSSIASRESVIPDNVDIIMSHGPSRGILDRIPSKDEHAGCDSMLRAVSRSRPLLHCFGHIHESHGWKHVLWDEDTTLRTKTHRAVVKHSNSEDANELDVIKGQSTLMLNAAIMNDCNQPVYSPWLVELDL